jgi:hypothetical protein
MEPRAQQEPQQTQAQAQPHQEPEPPDTLDAFLLAIAAKLRAGEYPESALLREGAQVREYPITYEDDGDGFGEYALVHWVPPESWSAEIEMETFGAMQGFRFNLDGLHDDE